MDTMGLQFGLMNTLGRLAGDGPLASLVLCALVPLLFSHAPQVLIWIKQCVARFWDMDPKYARRTIVFESGDNMLCGPSALGMSEEASTERNNILQKAIRMYINRDKDKLNIQDAELYMLAAPTCAASGKGAGDEWDRLMRGPPIPGYGTRHVRNIGDVDAGLKRLMGYAVARGPKQHRWLLVDRERQIEFRHYASAAIPDAHHDCGGAGKGGKPEGRSARAGPLQTTTFELRCCAGDAQRAVDDFVDEALQHYKDMRMGAVDRSRYFFMPVARPVSSAGSDDDHPWKGAGRGGAPRRYKKYVLSEHKTFESLFFAEKRQVLSALDDFVSMRGKFAIPGFPNKLGLLLHGPPGTGKTSLIKSIAQYTKRHIVEVPLTKVKSNQELFDSMFDLVFPVSGDDEALRMDFKDVIFVLEDVDAASEIVYSRSKGKDPNPKRERKGRGEDLASGMGLGKGMGALLGRGKGGLGKGAGEGTTRLPAALTAAPPGLGAAGGHLAAPPAVLTAVAPECAAPADKAGGGAPGAPAGGPPPGHPSALHAPWCAGVGVDDEDATDEPGDETDGSIAPKKKNNKSGDNKNKTETDPDALNLAGLLNVLDGVVDSPGRIVVLTTNHPEKLDPALIRPGRINFTVELGHMKAEPLQQLIQHLVQEEMTDAQRDLAATIASESRVVPAQVEQLCAETDGIDELLARLHQMAGPGSKGQKVIKQPSEDA